MSSIHSMNSKILLHFLRKNQGSEVTLKETSGALCLTGKLTDFNELDLCGRLLVEFELSLEISGLKASLTLHEKFLGVQVSGQISSSSNAFVIAREVLYQKLKIKNKT